MTHISPADGEARFLGGYDPDAFARPSLAVDLILLAMGETSLRVLLRQRETHPAKGRWGLPGGFVAIDESLDAAAARILGSKAQLRGVHLEQLFTFGAVARDPRMRIVSVAYIALLSADRLAAAQAAAPGILAGFDLSGGMPLAADGTAPPLAFDNGEMLRVAVERLRGKLDYAPIAFALLNERFTLRALQDVHEAIRGQPLNKPAFRRRMLDTGWLTPTGERETGTSYRPAELYRHRARAKDRS